MHFKRATALAAVTATGALALENTHGTNLGINPDSMISYKGIYFGFAPCYDPALPVSAGYSGLNKATGQKAATYNVYSQINQDNVNSGSYDGNYQYNVDDIIESGAVLIASLMPEVDWTDITPSLSSSIANYFQTTFTDKGTTVWLRFAHEMNYYSIYEGPKYPGGDNPGEFKTAWSNVYNAVKGNDKIHMFWSPNQASVDDINPWFPSVDQIDLVGMDVYPKVDSASDVPTFANTYGSFYDAFASPYSLPFALGETGAVSSSGGTTDISVREAWVKAVLDPASGDFSDYPLYMSATWFEYHLNDQTDFYVVHGDGDVQATISNTENGSA